LQQGHIFASVKKLSGASQYLVKIPNGIAGVRGTKLSIDADGTVAVLTSSSPSDVVLSITKPDGAVLTYVIAAGNQFDPQSGQTGPLAPEFLGLLQRIAISLDTTYLEIVSFSYDITSCNVSSKSGLPGVNNTP
jgi:hypothetical protein